MEEDIPGPVSVLPPIAVVGHAALEDARAQLPAAHKALLCVRERNRLFIATALGCSNEQALVGQSITAGDGFLGWTIESASPQVRANLQYVPPGAPDLTELEHSLEAKSAMAAPLAADEDHVFLMALFVCHGFVVFTLDDMDRLVAIAQQWTHRLAAALDEPESREWLAERMAPFVPAQAPGVTAQPAAEPDAPAPEQGSLPADYTAEDVNVLLSVFGMDLTTRSSGLARVLKADVGEFMKRDVKDIFAAGPGAGERGREPEEDAADETAPPSWFGTAPEPTAPDAESHEQYSAEDVGRILSVFGVDVKTSDSPLARALGTDVGSLLSKDVGSLLGKGGSDQDVEPAPWEEAVEDPSEGGPSASTAPGPSASGAPPVAGEPTGSGL